MDLKEIMAKILGEDHFQFYRCYKCRSILSAMQVSLALQSGNGTACKCGSKSIQPTQPLVEEYSRYNVIEFGMRALGATEAEYIKAFMDHAAEEKVPEVERIAVLNKIKEMWPEVATETEPQVTSQ